MRRGDYGSGTESIVARQTIYHDTERSSNLAIPLEAPETTDREFDRKQ